MGAVSPIHLIIVLVIALLILGPGKLPEVGAALGKSIREFKKATTEMQDVTSISSSVVPGAVTVAPAAPVVDVTPSGDHAG